MNPYRGSLPVVQSGLVFCKDCRFFERELGGTLVCHAPAEDSDPITGNGNPRRRNDKLDCPHYDPPARSWIARLFA